MADFNLEEDAAEDIRADLAVVVRKVSPSSLESSSLRSLSRTTKKSMELLATMSLIFLTREPVAKRHHEVSSPLALLL